MLFIRRKFTLGIDIRSLEIIETKMKEFNIDWYRKKFYEPPIKQIKIIKVYYECTASEDDMDKLIEYLQLEFKGLASITF